MLADFLVHTAFSDDSVYPMEQVAADTVRLNLDAVCFTDHVDYGVKPDAGEPPRRVDPESGKPVTNVDYAAYVAEFGRVRAAVGDEADLCLGLELGVQRHTVASFERVLDAWGDRLDFCLGSHLRVAQLALRDLGFEEFHTYRRHEPVAHPLAP